MYFKLNGTVLNNVPFGELSRKNLLVAKNCFSLFIEYLHNNNTLSYYFWNSLNMNRSTAIDLDLFREEKGGNPEVVRQSQKARFKDPEDVDRIIAVDKEWRESTLWNYIHKIFYLFLKIFCANLISENNVFIRPCTYANINSFIKY